MILNCVSIAQASPIAKTYDRQSYVAIAGTADETYAGFSADLLLVKSTSDKDNITKEDIGYIGQTIIEADGDYRFEFYFDKFTYDESGTVDNYEIILNVNGENITPSVTRAEVMSEFVSFQIDFEKFGTAVAEIENMYNLKAIEYTTIIAFYSNENKLLGIKRFIKKTGDDPNVTYGYNDIPDGTSKAKAFIWERGSHMIPLAKDEAFDVVAHTENREVMMLTIAPGKDETERNFAWYDIPGVEDVRIQYAVKTGEDDLTTFPEENATTVSATYGDVDVSEYEGLKANSYIFTYNNEYSWGKATIKNLEKGKSYVYRIGDKFGWCNKIYEFKTDEAPEEGFKFILFSDEHSTTEESSIAAMTLSREKAIETAPDASIVYALGDNVDLPGYESYYENYFNRKDMTSLPLAAIPGSTHDYMWTHQDASLFGYHFNMPNQSDTSGYIKNVGGNYWYRYGDVLFIGIMHNWHTYHKMNNTNVGDDILEETKEFVKLATQENPDAKWKILCAHLPFGYNNDDANYVEDFWPSADEDFIADNGIDVVFNGHTHRFVRSYQMYAGKPVNTDVLSEVTNPEGTVFFSLNTSGGLGKTIARDDSWMAVCDSTGAGYLYSTRLSYFSTHYSIATVRTTDEECSLTIDTYQNTHDKLSYEITKTEKIDSYKIIKTKK